MHAAADRCQRIGACRKTGSGVMCPSYMATREEEHATRGRANALVKALERARSRERRWATSACTRSSTSASSARRARASARCRSTWRRMKSEFLSHYNAIHGTPLRSRLFGSIRTLNRIGSCNGAAVERCPSRAACWRRSPGSTAQAPAAALRARDADQLGRERSLVGARRRRGEVVFLADSFTTFTEPGVGRAAIELLDAAGYDVRLESARLLRAGEHLQGPARRREGQGRGAVRAPRRDRHDHRRRALVPADAARGARRAARRPRASRSARGSSRSCWSRRSTTARCA